MHKHDEIFCTICKKTVPEDRVLRQAVTCSKECARTLKNLRRPAPQEIGSIHG
jgi:predicted nucleic acid-binding Zn ribbon protein